MQDTIKKPWIHKVNGIWQCQGSGCHGCGMTPKQAYELWAIYTSKDYNPKG